MLVANARGIVVALVEADADDRIAGALGAASAAGRIRCQLLPAGGAGAGLIVAQIRLPVALPLNRRAARAAVIVRPGPLAGLLQAGGLVGGSSSIRANRAVNLPAGGDIGFARDGRAAADFNPFVTLNAPGFFRKLKDGG